LILTTGLLQWPLSMPRMLITVVVVASTLLVVAIIDAGHPVRCSVGQAVVTGPGECGSLQVPYVIHAARSIYCDYDDDDDDFTSAHNFLNRNTSLPWTVSCRTKFKVWPFPCYPVVYFELRSLWRLSWRTVSPQFNSLDCVLRQTNWRKATHSCHRLFPQHARIRVSSGTANVNDLLSSEIAHCVLVF
jgi:hypothetical protein